SSLRYLPLNAVVVPLMLLILDPHAAKDEVNVRVGKAESDEHEGLLYEIASKGGDKGGHLQRIGFVLIFADDGVRRMVDIPVHFVNNNISVGPGDGELFQRVLYVGDLLGVFERSLD